MLQTRSIKLLTS